MHGSEMRLSYQCPHGARRIGDYSSRMLSAFRAGWRHARERRESLRVYATWPNASAYWFALRLGRLGGNRLRVSSGAA